MPEPQTPPEYRLREGPDPGANSPTGPGGGVGRVVTRVARDFLIANLYLRLGIAASVVPGLAGPVLEGAGAALEAGEVVADAMSASGASAAAAEATPGTIYIRRNVATGEEYVGQAKPGRYLARQAEHAADHPGEKFVYHVLEEVKPGSGRSLDVAEEDWIRAGGGPQRSGGRLANDRYQMSDKAYKAAGGTLPKPTR